MQPPLQGNGGLEVKMILLQILLGDTFETSFQSKLTDDEVFVFWNQLTVFDKTKEQQTHKEVSL